MGTTPPGTRRVAGWRAAGGAPTVRAMDVPGISRPVLVVLIVAAVVLFAFGATNGGRPAHRAHRHADAHAGRRADDRGPSPADRRRRIVAADRTDVRADHEGEALDLGRRPRQGERRRRGPAPQGPLRRPPGRRRPLRRGLDPRGAARTSVRVVTGTGDLRAENLQGGAELSAGTGDLHAIGVQRAAAAAARRPATCTSRGRRPTSSRARARATSTSRPAGPGTIDAQADTGDIHISVPDLTYAVDAQTDTGDDNVDVRPTTPRRARCARTRIPATCTWSADG